MEKRDLFPDQTVAVAQSEGRRITSAWGRPPYARTTPAQHPSSNSTQGSYPSLALSVKVAFLCGVYFLAQGNEKVQTAGASMTTPVIGYWLR